jgi:hypothetical protein
MQVAMHQADYFEQRANQLRANYNRAPATQINEPGNPNSFDEDVEVDSDAEAMQIST